MNGSSKNGRKRAEIQNSCLQLTLKYVRTSTSRVHAPSTSCVVESKYDNISVDVSHHTGDARALFGAFETSTGVLLYLLSTEYGTGDACTRDVDVRTYLRGSCEHVF